jgi:hypothetical protein
MGGIMGWTADDVELVRIDWLKPHEEIRAKNMQQLKMMTLRWGGFTKPLLADAQSGAILDGHHRYNVGLALNLVRLPVLLCDYLNDDDVEVEVWPNCGIESISKQDVLDMALSGELFPPKSSRHILANDIPPIMVSLEKLQQGE